MEPFRVYDADEEGRARETSAKAARARQLLDDPLLTEAFDEVRKQWTEALVECRIDDVTGMQGIKRMLGCLDKIKGYLQSVMDGGIMADQRIIDLERMKNDGTNRPVEK